MTKMRINKPVSETNESNHRKNQRALYAFVSISTTIKREHFQFSTAEEIFTWFMVQNTSLRLMQEIG